MSIVGFFPSLSTAKYDNVVGIIAFLLLVSLVACFIAFKIQQARHPENFTPPSDKNKLSKKFKQLGPGNLLLEAIFDKDKILLSDRGEKITTKKSTKFSAKFFVAFLIYIILFITIILSIYFYLLDAQKNNPEEYSKISAISTVAGKIQDSRFYKTVIWVTKNIVAP